MIDPELPDSRRDSISRATLRQFAGLWLICFVGLACWQWLGRGRTTAAFILAAVGLAVGLIGLVKPPAIRPLFSALMTVTFPIGWAVSHVLLALLYYAVITPMALLFKMIGRDALSRRRRTGQATYWQPKLMPTEARSYFRQS